jgi:hypothetical protein
MILEVAIHSSLEDHFPHVDHYTQVIANKNAI